MEAWGLLLRLFLNLRNHIHAVAARFELTPVQAHVLHLLQPGVALPMSALAVELGCDASNVTGLVDRLEGRGLIERKLAEHDRRVKMLASTPAGLELRAAMLEQLLQTPELLKQIPEENLRALRDLLRGSLPEAILAPRP
jgi:DNA-binding MarR family transcriptional regulator